MINDSAIMGYKIDDGFGVISLPEKPNNKHQHPSNTTRLTIWWRNRGNGLSDECKMLYLKFLHMKHDALNGSTGQKLF
jgi:hypothetical protein